MNTLSQEDCCDPLKIQQLTTRQCVARFKVCSSYATSSGYLGAHKMYGILCNSNIKSHGCKNCNEFLEGQLQWKIIEIAITIACVHLLNQAHLSCTPSLLKFLLSRKSVASCACVSAPVCIVYRVHISCMCRV